MKFCDSERFYSLISKISFRFLGSMESLTTSFFTLLDEIFYLSYYFRFFERDLD
jgi:hypothetical protein